MTDQAAQNMAAQIERKLGIRHDSIPTDVFEAGAHAVTVPRRIVPPVFWTPCCVIHNAGEHTNLASRDNRVIYLRDIDALIDALQRAREIMRQVEAESGEASTPDDSPTQPDRPGRRFRWL